MMIEPSLRSIICGTTMLISQLLATMLLSRILRNWSSEMPRERPVIRVGRGVADQHVDLAERAVGSRRQVLQIFLADEMLAAIATAVPLPNLSLISLATWSQTSCLREEITTLAPCSAIRSAMARPMPRVEPVMTATFPVMSNKVMSLSPMLIRRNAGFGR